MDIEIVFHNDQTSLIEFVQKKNKFNRKIIIFMKRKY